MDSTLHDPASLSNNSSSTDMETPGEPLAACVCDLNYIIHVPNIIAPHALNMQVCTPHSTVLEASLLIV